MAQAEGSQAKIIYDEETTYKQDPATPDAKVLPFKSESLRLSRNLVESEVITASRDSKKPGRGNYEVSGSIELEINPYIGTILKHALGYAATAGTGPYTHTLKIDTLPVGLVIEKGFKDIGQYFKYNGCRINALKMSFAAEGKIAGSIDVLGAKETVSSASFDSTPTDFGHDPFDAFEASIEEGGAAIAIVTECEFTLENNLDGSVYVIGGGGERYSLPAGKTKVSGTLKALFEDLSLYNKAIGHTETSLKITLKKGDGLGSAGNESMEILIPELVYQPNAPVISGPQGVLVELPFIAYYDDSAEATTLQITLKNTVASI